jgi:L-alanine-DL-glutamate epimerase-like enolase superfamily enzyme
MSTRIASIEPIPVCFPEPNDHDANRSLCLVRLVARDGGVGWGEAVTMWPEAARAVAAVVEGLAPLVVDRDPVDSEAIWRSLRGHTWWYGRGGIASFAIAAIDIAVWDLKGKCLGRPVVDLLGGPVHGRLPAIASGHASIADLEAQVEAVAGWTGGGMQGVKVGFGKRGHANLGYLEERDVGFVRLLREALGPEKQIMIDIGNAIEWDLSTAVRRVRAMEEFDLRWIEEPLGPDDPRGYAVLRAATHTLIACGEREWDLPGYRRMLGGGAVDVVGVDPGRAEGITCFRKVCDLVEAAHCQANAHAWSTAIGTAASLAVSFATPVCRQFELKPIENPMQHELVAEPFGHSDGWVLPPSGPGLGIEVRESVVERYRL